MAGVPAPRDRGAGLLSTVAGVVVFLVFLLFAVQLLFGLYASSTVNAVANDAAARAASADAPPLDVIEAQARASLGEVGARGRPSRGAQTTRTATVRSTRSCSRSSRVRLGSSRRPSAA